MNDSIKKISGPLAVLIVTAGVVVYWAVCNKTSLDGTTAARYLAYGRLAGLLGAVCFLFLTLTMGKKRIVEPFFDKQFLFKAHKYVGFSTVLLVGLHFFLIFKGKSLRNYESFLTVTGDFFKNFLGLLTGTSVAFLVIVLAFCALFVLKKMNFPTWRKTHYLVYLVIVPVFFHQVMYGNDFQNHRFFMWLWIAVFTLAFAELLIAKIRASRNS